MKPPDRPATPHKKPYRSPVLRVYGNIRAITQAVGATGAMDGTGMLRTRP